jgi:hypothetical protein
VAVLPLRFYGACRRGAHIWHNRIKPPICRTDAADMLSIPPPMSNLERQRRFRASHPGYFNKYNARRRAKKTAIVEEVPTEALALAAPREPLMLPAPVQTIEIPGMNTISPISMNSQFSVA